MPDGNSKLDAAAAAEAFGLNIACCLKLLGKDFQSLAIRTDIDQRVLIGYKLGQGQLTDSRIEAIANVFGVEASVLTNDYTTDVVRTDALQKALIKSGQLSLGQHKLEAEPSAPKVTEQSKPEPVPSSATQTLTWDTDGLVATIGSVKYDLKTKQLRSLVMGHIRAAKGSHTNNAINAAAKLGKASSWWSSVEVGKARMYRADLEKIASHLKVSVDVLLTGRGLDTSKMSVRGRSSNALVAIKRVIELPPVSKERKDAFFRDRVLNAKTEPAEGVSFGQLLELARNQDDVDWEDAWLNLTKHGATVKQLINKWDADLNKVGEPIQLLIIEKLCQRFNKTAE